MHVAMIIDEQRLAQEHAMLKRLSVGLMGDGFRITRIVPNEIASEHVYLSEQRVALAERLEVQMQVFPWLRSDRIEQIAGSMTRHPPDVVFAIGQNAWKLGLDLARHLDCPLLLEVCSPRQARKVPTGKRAEVISAYVTPTEAMAGVLRQYVDPDLVSVLPYGVAVPDRPRLILDPKREIITAAIVGGGRDIAAYRALLVGLSGLMGELPNLQLFLELRGPCQHEIWRYARKLKLLGSISTLTEASPHRSLLTQCDALLLPERYGELDTLTLEAMGCSMAILASQDPMLEMLEHDQTALLAEEDNPDEWGQLLRRALLHPEPTRKIGMRAREYVLNNNLSSTQVANLADLLERVVTGGSYSFSEASAS